MILRKSLVILLSVFSLGLLNGCEETDADKIGDAQLCLDKATSATAASCLDKIAGIETAAANVIRCSAGFMEEGFTDPQRLISAIDQLDSGGDGTTGLLSVMAFSSQGNNTLNLEFINTVYGYCEKSQQKSMQLLATMAKSATLLASIAGISLQPGATITAADIKAAITDLTSGSYSGGDPTEALGEIGSAVTTTYQMTCSSGSSKDSDLCTEINNAINSAGVDINDPASVGNKILELWKASTGS